MIVLDRVEFAYFIKSLQTKAGEQFMKHIMHKTQSVEREGAHIYIDGVGAVVGVCASERVSIGLSQSIKSISYVMPHVRERASNEATLEAIKHNNNKMLQQLRVAKQKGGKSKSDIKALASHGTFQNSKCCCFLLHHRTEEKSVAW